MSIPKMSEQPDSSAEEVLLVQDDVVTVPSGKKASFWETWLGLVKCSIGAGIFALPWAMAQSGLVLGVIAMALLAALALYTMLLLVRLKRIAQTVDPEVSTFSGFAETIAPRWGRLLLEICIFVCNIGVPAGYLVFININLRSIPELPFASSSFLADLICVPTAIILAWLPNTRFLSRAAAMGIIFLIAALVLTLVFAGANGSFITSSIVLVNFSRFPLCFGILSLLFCVHGVALPLQQGMYESERFPTVLKLGSACVSAICIPFAMFGYWAFTTETQGYIFCNIPHNIFLSIVKFSLALELLFSIPLISFPALKIFQQWVGIKESSVWKRRFSITLLIVVAWGFSIVVPFFDNILSLVGALGCATVGFVLPPLLDVVATRSILKTEFKARDYFNMILVKCGSLLVFATIYLNIQDIVQKYRQSGSGSSFC
jgi:amino acid permease